MKKLLLLLVLVAGCTANDETIFIRSNNTVTLKVTQRTANGNSVTVELKTKADAEKYRERLQKIIKEIDEFENELKIREKP